MKSNYRRFLALIVLFAVLPVVCGCDLGDKGVLLAFRKYFPAAYLLKFDQRVLWVQTDVSNISRDFAKETFDAFLQKPEISYLKSLMDGSGYQVLVVGFKGYVVTWMPSAGRFWVLDPQEADTWAQQALGYTFTAMYPNMKTVR